METYFTDRSIVSPSCGKSYLNGRTIYSERRSRYTAEISASWHFRESAGGAERMTEDCGACAKSEASQRACLSPL
jgi:hypothetical protein